MIGSAYPDAIDALPIPEGTDWAASMLRELAGIMVATQKAIGAEVGSGSSIGLSTATWREMFNRRAMMEAGIFTTTGTAYAAQVVNFAQPNKFDGVPKVFVFEKTYLAAVVHRGSRVSATATNFTIWAPYSSARTLRYLAVDPAFDL